MALSRAHASIKVPDLAAGLTARGWTRTLRLARTIADLDGAEAVRRVHVAEALIYRRVAASRTAARKLRAVLS